MSRNRKAPAMLNGETRRLQQAMAIVIACQTAAEEGADFDVPDVLAVVAALLGESLRGLDRLEAASRPPR